MLLSIIALAGSLATADQYKTVKQESNEDRVEYSVSYPELFPTAVPAYASINAQIKSSVTEDCGKPEKDGPDFYYNVQASVVALNPLYVGVAVTTNTYCGGAHPNYGTYYLTYDAKTGNALAIDKEFGFLDYDDPEYDVDKMDALRKKLAVILVDKIPAVSGQDYDCFKGTRKEKLENLETYFPVVQGLAKNKTVVIGIQPPHVASVCQFDARFTYAEIRNLLTPTSYLHRWLK